MNRYLGKYQESVEEVSGAALGREALLSTLEEVQEVESDMVRSGTCAQRQEICCCRSTRMKVQWVSNELILSGVMEQRGCSPPSSSGRFSRRETKSARSRP